MDRLILAPQSSTGAGSSSWASGPSVGLLLEVGFQGQHDQQSVKVSLSGKSRQLNIWIKCKPRNDILGLRAINYGNSLQMCFKEKERE